MPQHFSAAYVSAAAAILAAVLAGLNLALTGWRDERRWRREALTEVLVTFLDATFKGVRKTAVDDRDNGLDISVHEQASINSHVDMLTSMTRLRMLADAKVVRQAEAVHENLDEMYDLVYKIDRIVDPAEATIAHETFAAKVTERQSLRNEFVRLARSNLGLTGAAPIKLGGTDDSGPRLREVTKDIPEMKVHLVSDLRSADTSRLLLWLRSNRKKNRATTGQP